MTSFEEVVVVARVGGREGGRERRCMSDGGRREKSTCPSLSRWWLWPGPDAERREGGREGRVGL